MSQKIDGKLLAASIKEKLRAEIEEMEFKPTLAVIMVGNNAASQTYVRNKTKACAEVGIESRQYNLEENTSTEALVNLIDMLNNDDYVDGILVQLPLPPHIDSELVINKIALDKDVDGFRQSSHYVQCTPLGVIELIGSLRQKVARKTALIIGRSDNVGKPIAKMLLDLNCTTIVAHSRTPKEVLARMFNMADIVVSAVGKPHIISEADGVEQNNSRIIIDVGINRDENNKLCGDFSEEFKQKYSGYYTPVPGGVGPMTVAMLMFNTVTAAKNNIQKIKEERL